MRIDIILESNNSPSGLRTGAARRAVRPGASVSNMNDAGDFSSISCRPRWPRNASARPDRREPSSCTRRRWRALLTLFSGRRSRRSSSVAAHGPAIGIQRTRIVRAARECVEILNIAATAPVRYVKRAVQGALEMRGWVENATEHHGRQRTRCCARPALCRRHHGQRLPVNHVRRVRSSTGARGRPRAARLMNNFWACTQGDARGG